LYTAVQVPVVRDLNGEQKEKTVVNASREHLLVIFPVIPQETRINQD
jgi:hypothetical protein